MLAHVTVAEAGSKVRGGWPIAILMWAIYTAGMVILLTVATEPYKNAHLIMAQLWWIIALLGTFVLDFLGRTELGRGLFPRPKAA